MVCGMDNVVECVIDGCEYDYVIVWLGVCVDIECGFVDQFMDSENCVWIYCLFMMIFYLLVNCGVIFGFVVKIFIDFVIVLCLNCILNDGCCWEIYVCNLYCNIVVWGNVKQWFYCVLF